MSSLKASVELVSINKNNVSSSLQNIELQSGKEGKKNNYSVLEIACLTLAIAIIVGLSTLPTVFFYITASDGSSSNGTSTNMTNITDVSTGNCTEGLQGKNCICKCSKNFIFDETTLKCSPSCPEWTALPESVAMAQDYVILIVGPFGMLSGIVLLVVSFIKWKKVYVFPSVLVIYQTIDLLILIVFHIITYFDRAHLYCTSPYFLESILDSTNFCVVAGVFVHYLYLQIQLWWVMHMAALFWKVFFHFHAQSFQSTKVLHAVCVVVGLLVPVIPAMAPIINNAVVESRSNESVLGTHGFGFFLSPNLCVGLDENITFYTLILPNILLLPVGCIPLILTIYQIHKVQGFFRSSQLHPKSPFHINTAEKKLLILFFYYVFFQTIGTVYFLVYHQAEVTLQRELFIYFICEQNGHANNTCSRSGFENVIPPGMLLLSLLLTMIAPTINFVFVIDYREMKQHVKDLCTKKSKN